MLNKDIYGPYQTANYFPTMYKTTEEVDAITLLKTDIDSYVKEMTAKWMMYGGVDEEWDTYLEHLKTLGIDEYLAAYQSAYDRYLSNK